MSAATSSGPLMEARTQQAQHIDWWLVLASLVLLLVGLMSLYSIDAGASGGRYFLNQVIRLAIGIVPFLALYLVNPKALQRYASVLYVVNLAFLGLVLIVGSTKGGAQRWLNLGPLEFQPSEMSKLLTVITLATFFASREPAQLRSLSTFVLSLVHVLVPIAFIFKQPHLGASLAMLVAWAGVSLCAGVKVRYLLGTVLGAAALIGLAFVVPGVLKDYQKERIIALLGGGDPKGSRFHALRAQSAFAAGNLTGVGYMKGEQKNAGFVPEQQTDFIFTVIGEEGGLVGCTLVLSAFGFFFYRIWLILYRSQDRFHQMLAAGVFSYLAFHTVANIGMNLELLPVVGLWLPFMSFGGTAIWLCLASVGLLLNIRSREKPVLF